MHRPSHDACSREFAAGQARSCVPQPRPVAAAHHREALVHAGRDKYAGAVATIFSPDTAHADLITSEVVDGDKIKFKWRLEGIITQAGISFQFKPYTGETIYTLSDETGKIVQQCETWDISIFDVFASIFWPRVSKKLGGAPPAPPADELRRQANSA